MEVAGHIAQMWGAEVIYIPKNLILLLSVRDRKIFNEFNGTNHRELPRKYSVSMQEIYQIVKRVTKEEIARQQFDMFGEKYPLKMRKRPKGRFCPPRILPKR